MEDGINLHTALVIQGNDVNVETYLDKDRKKYGFVISRMERSNYREIVSTTPVYDSKRQARKAGKNFVSEVRKMDLSPQQSKLEEIMGPEVTKAVSDITKAVNSNS